MSLSEIISIVVIGLGVLGIAYKVKYDVDQLKGTINNGLTGKINEISGHVIGLGTKLDSHLERCDRDMIKLDTAIRDLQQARGCGEDSPKRGV